MTPILRFACFDVALFCFLSAVILILRANSLTDNYDVYSGSSKRKIRKSRLIAIALIAVGIIFELLVVLK